MTTTPVEQLADHGSPVKIRKGRACDKGEPATTNLTSFFPREGKAEKGERGGGRGQLLPPVCFTDGEQKGFRRKLQKLQRGAKRFQVAEKKSRKIYTSINFSCCSFPFCFFRFGCITSYKQTKKCIKSKSLYTFIIHHYFSMKQSTYSLIPPSPESPQAIQDAKVPAFCNQFLPAILPVGS